MKGREPSIRTRVGLAAGRAWGCSETLRKADGASRLEPCAVRLLGYRRLPEQDGHPRENKLVSRL